MTNAQIARATLLRVTEPGTAFAAYVAKHGVDEALAHAREGRAIDGIDVEAIRHRLNDASGEADLERAASVGARLIGPGDDEWPVLLADLGRIPAACSGLWVKGQRLDELVPRSAALVGTRTPTDYGIGVAGDLAVGLADRGWTVVSGLAYGIDAAAHRGALSAQGATIGVLACGIDVPYPNGNRRLCDEITATGAVVSEHPPGAAPQRHRFLVRNRIIAALALGTVVVEAGARSGARSTANHAAALLRHVMAVPGPVTSQMSVGAHRVLREIPGAMLVTRAEEIIELCGHLGELADPVSGPVRPRDRLGPVVRRVFDAVPVQSPSTPERIATVAGVSPATAEPCLAALAAQGLVDRTPRGWRMSRAGREERRSDGHPDIPLPLAWM